MNQNTGNRSRNLAAAVLFALLSCVSLQAADTLIAPNSDWRYFAGPGYPPGQWQLPGYDGRDWPEGPGVLGYGEDYITTTVPFGPNANQKYTTTCFRKAFELIADPASLLQLSLSTNFDDGFIAYLNGIEVVRRGLPAGSVSYGTFAASHEGGNYERIDISGFRDLLVAGSNQLAVEVHQTSLSSSDLVWDVLLTASDNPVEWMWSGAITPQSARVKAKLVVDSVVARLALDTQPDFQSAFYSDFDTALVENSLIVDFELSDLPPNTRYYYAIEAGDNLNTELTGSFQTFPEGSASFAFGFASCATTGSDHEVFQTIHMRDPLFFLHTGDFHYENITSTDPQTFRDAYEAVLGSPRQAQLYSDLPLVYIWDDHDYGPNNSDSTAPGRLAARLTYQEYLPHYPLAASSGDVPIYQAFTVGRVRFIVTDCRSARSPWSAPDNASKTMLGVEQKAWFKEQLLAARFTYPVIVWVNTLPWIGVTGDDGWYLYTNERRELADFIADNHISQLCMLSGDAHMLAIDDGSNSDYSDTGGAGFPVFQAAALDRAGSVKGGPYSHGAYPGGGQFGWMEVDDLGDSIVVNWTGFNYLEDTIVAYSFAMPGDVSPLCGDVDGDRRTDLSDVVYLIQFIFAGGPVPQPLTGGDVNCDGLVNITDAVYLIQYIFSGGNPPCDTNGDDTPDC